MAQPTAAAVSASDLTGILSNITIRGIIPEPITLTNGIYEYQDGSNTTPYVRLVDSIISTGDLNGDDLEDAVALVEDNPVGSARFFFAVPVLDVKGKATPAPAMLLGDRIGVKSIAFDGTEVVANLIVQGTGDADCCAHWNVRNRYAFENGALVERSSEKLGKASLADLSGTRWILLNLNDDQEPVLEGTEITLVIADGTLSGSAGCNTYNAGVSSKPEDSFTFVVGPIATTQKTCPEPAMNQESTYLSRLGKAVSWWIDVGRLAILLDRGDGNSGALVFAPMP